MSSDVIDDPNAATRQTPYGDLAMLHANLAEFCAAGRPVAGALTALQHDLERSAFRDDCAALARDLEQGVPFAEAYARRGTSFPPVYRALVEAGVESGDVAGVLRDISVDASLRARVRDGLRRKLEYPLVVAAVVLAVGIAIALAVPRTLDQVSVQFDLWLGNVVSGDASRGWSFGWSAVGVLVVLPLIGLIFAALRKPLDPGSGPRGVRYRVPFVGRMRGYAAKAGFASTMALLLRRGLPLPRALELCAAGAESDEVRRQIERMVAQAERGENLSGSLRAGELLPPHLLWFVEAAGSSEVSVRALEDIASVYRSRLQRATDRVAAYAVPAVEVAVGLVVLLFALDYVKPAYEFMSQVFGG